MPAGERCSEPAVGLSSGGTPRWLSATAAIVERAWTLREAPVEALVLEVPSSSVWGVLGPLARVVRIDPASEPLTVDAEERTRDLVADWDELLHRLAK